MKIFIYILSALFVLGRSAFAAIDDRVVVTWNLQGASASTESKWNVNVRQLLVGPASSSRRQVDIMTIQEAGSPPQSAVREPPLGNRLENPDNVAAPVEEYSWNLGTRNRPNIYYIYFSRVDQGANRVNLAIVSRQRADSVLLLRASTWTGARPVLGIRLGSDHYFGIHALANGGSDSGVIVRRVWDYFAQNQNRSQWMISGDFNRSPALLAALLYQYYPNVYQNVSLQNQQQPTQRSGGNLDYGVVGQFGNPGGGAVALNRNLFTPGLLGQLASDHSPILFSPNK